MITYSIYEILFYLLLYAFLGWVAEVCYYSVVNRHFVNRGLISLPLHIPCGISVALLIQVLPFLGNNYVLQFIAAAIVLSVVQSLGSIFSQRVSRLAHWEREAGFTATGRSWVKMALCASIVLLFYHVVHPFFLSGVSLFPRWLLPLIVWGGFFLLGVDFIMMLWATRSRKASASGEITRARTQRLADRITGHIWTRLERAYPGIAEEREEGGNASDIVFARGICWDKIIWIFLFSALLGDIIETLYCGLVDGKWMNRSSVLYGPFSFVWGIGAVLLTVALRHMMEKPDRYIFVRGFLIGGTYEYICSVFTERVFGTVFWDYSDMPLNIGGRTNVLFCIFWGLLAVLWVKVLYPPLNRQIEKIPPLAGKVLTWLVVFFMACNGILTAAAMVRYNTRSVRPEANGMAEAFIDGQYNDAYMEKRWPNMVMADGK